MSKFQLLASAAAFLLAGPALAQDIALGEKEFNKCKACHSITAADGAVVVKGGKAGPNLGGIVGRHVAGDPDFRGYGDAIKAVGEAGLVWDEAELAVYMTDPGAWLKDKTGDAGAKTKMTFKLAKNQADLAAYLASVAPAADAAAAPAEEAPAEEAATN